MNPPAVYRVRTVSSGTWRSLEVIATNCLADPSIEGVVLNLRDVTRTVEVTRAYATFGRTNQMLLQATSEGELFQQTCETIIEVGGYAAAWIGVTDDGEQRSVTPVASAGRVAHLAEAAISWADDAHGQGPVGLALRSNKPHAVRDLLSSGAPVSSRALLQDAGLRACCALPIDCGDGIRRVLVISDSEVRDFDDEELQLFMELANNLAFGLRELRSAAARVQSEARFRTLAASSPIGIVETGLRWVRHLRNERMTEIAGATHPEALHGRGWIDFIDPEDRLRSASRAPELEWRGRQGLAVSAPHLSGVIRHVQGRVAAKSGQRGIRRHHHRRHRRSPRTRGAHSSGARRSADWVPEPHAVLLELRQQLQRGRRSNDVARDPLPRSRPSQAHQRQSRTRGGRRRHRERISLFPRRCGLTSSSHVSGATSSCSWSRRDQGHLGSVAPIACSRRSVARSRFAAFNCR